MKKTITLTVKEIKLNNNFQYVKDIFLQMVE